ncbi:DNA topoisomerase [Vibrio agarivorans]|uniref:DNA topoisomerase n=1 Tax=Vibrio agarivorans TaxID=153622 RepID=A0ABT7Y7G1_9VIBR|nr:DNA topoisomerase [Vibrio agarivorans]
MIGVIAEKPEVANEIARTLSSDYNKKDGHIVCHDISMIITWCVGNMLELDDPEVFNPDYKRWDLSLLPMKWPVRFSPNPKTKKQLGLIKKSLSGTSKIINACDIDGAGEWIFWSCYEYCGFKQPVDRVLITDNNLIAAAWEKLKPGKDFYLLGQSEKARSIVDQRFGYNLTRALSAQAKKQGASETLNTGRVQAVFLGLVYRRELANANFKPTDHFIVSIDVSDGYDGVINNCKFVLNEEIPTNEEGLLTDKSIADTIQATVQGEPVKLAVIKSIEKSDEPPLPFDLGSLQGECARLMNLRPDKVLKITQALRDKKCITYNRTDSRYLTDEHHTEAPALLRTLANVDSFSELIDFTDPSRKTAAFNSKKVSAHHAIVPTQNISQLDSLSDVEFDVYCLIARNYILQFMPLRVRQVVTAEFVHSTGARFKGSNSAVMAHGWNALFLNDSDAEGMSIDEELADPIDVSNFIEGEDYTVVASDTKAKSTKAPPLYTIPTLLKEVTQTAKLVTDPIIKAALLEKDKDSTERGGIGTSATRTPILTGLLDRKFLIESKKKIKTSLVGRTIVEALPDVITTPEQTAIWSMQQRQIENGSLSVEQFVDDIEIFIAEQVEVIKQGIALPKELIHEQVTSSCPSASCDGNVTSKKGRFGTYYVCDTCNQNFQDFDGAPLDNQYEPCPTCGDNAQLKVGKQSSLYWRCSGCSSNFSYENGELLVPVEAKCPSCSSKATKVKSGWRCHGDCGFLEDLNGAPHIEICPQCNKDRMRNFFVNRDPKQGVSYRGCSDFKNCGYKA